MEYCLISPDFMDEWVFHGRC